MKIGIFSKAAFVGGSELRCVELCNAIVKYTPHEAYLLSEEGAPSELLQRLDPRVKAVQGIFGDKANFPVLYEMDKVLVVNTDSKHFTSLDYWEGRSDKHKHFVDLSRIKQMTFLFNFIVSPAQHLWKIEEKCRDVRIVTTNRRFLGELGNKDKHGKIRHIPRMVLESPIAPDSVTHRKPDLTKIRIGKHSHAMGNKFNEETAELIRRMNAKYPDKLEWDFMGIPREREEELKKLPNVTRRKVFSLPVKEYLEGLHIFLFFISWDRQEPWARSVAEALMSGCPVLATDSDGGNREQIVQGCNGFLCKNLDDYEKHLSYLIENPDKIRKLGENAKLFSKFFTSEEIVRKLVKFLE